MFRSLTHLPLVALLTLSLAAAGCGPGGSKQAETGIQLEASYTLGTGEPLELMPLLYRRDTEEGIGSKSLEFRLDGRTLVSRTTDANGIGSYTLAPPIAVGNHTLSVRFMGDGAFSASEASAQVVVGSTSAPGKKNTLLELASEFRGGAGAPLTLPVRLKTATGSPVEGESLTLRGPGVSETEETGPDGSVAFEVTVATPGTYTLEVSYGGSEDYNMTRATTSLVIEPRTKTATEIKTASLHEVRYRENLFMGTTLCTPQGQKLEGKLVRLRIDNQDRGSETTSEAGAADFSLENVTLTPGDHTIQLTFAGTEEYAGTTTSATLRVNKGQSFLSAEAPTEATIGDNLLISGGLMNEDDSPIAGEVVQFSLGGVEVGSASTNSSGQASLSVPLTDAIGVGSKQLSIRWAGNSHYQGHSATGQVLIGKDSSELTLVADSPVSLGKPMRVHGQLRDGHNRPIAGASLGITIGGASVAGGVVNGAGEVDLVFDVPRNIGVGEKTIRVWWGGSATVTECSSETTTEVLPIATRLTVAFSPNKASYKRGERCDIVATLVEAETGRAIPGIAVKVWVRSDSSGRTNATGNPTTNSQGSATLGHLVSLNANDDSVYAYASFAGNETYSSCEATRKRIPIGN